MNRVVINYSVQYQLSTIGNRVNQRATVDKFISLDGIIMWPQKRCDSHCLAAICNGVKYAVVAPESARHYDNNLNVRRAAVRILSSTCTFLR